MKKNYSQTSIIWSHMGLGQKVPITESLNNKKYE